MDRLEDSRLASTSSPTDQHSSSVGFSTPLPSTVKSESKATPPEPSQTVVPDLAYPSLSDDAKNIDEFASSEEQTVSEETETGSYADVLQNKNFLALWSGQVFSQLSDKVFLVLLVALISSHFTLQDESISNWVAAVMVAFTIPAVLFGSVAGVYVDRWSKKRVMVGTNLIRGGLVLAVPILLWGIDTQLTLWGWPIAFLALLMVTFSVSTLTQFFAPAEQTALPLIVKKRNLLPANSLYTATMMASVIVGFAIGEPLLAMANQISVQLNCGPELGSEVAVGGGYTIAGTLLLLMVTGERRRSPHRTSADSPNGEIAGTSSDEQHSIGKLAAPKNNHVWFDIQEGLRYLGRSQRVRSAIGQMVVLFSIFAALAVLAVRLAELIPAITAAQFGVLLAAAGIGMALGALVVGQWGTQLPRKLWAALGSLGVAAALVTLAVLQQQLWTCLIDIACIGFSGALVGVPMQTLIQEETPIEMRGKVFGLQNNLVNIALSLPLALASLAEARFGLSTVLLALAAVAALSSLLGWRMMPPPVSQAKAN
ncbi:MAG: MFS transporter [Synechococcus sp.]